MWGFLEDLEQYRRGGNMQWYWRDGIFVNEICGQFTFVLSTGMKNSFAKYIEINIKDNMNKLNIDIKYVTKTN